MSNPMMGYLPEGNEAAPPWAYDPVAHAYIPIPPGVARSGLRIRHKEHEYQAFIEAIVRVYIIEDEKPYELEVPVQAVREMLKYFFSWNAMLASDPVAMASLRQQMPNSAHVVPSRSSEIDEDEQTAYFPESGVDEFGEVHRGSTPNYRDSRKVWLRRLLRLRPKRQSWAAAIGAVYSDRGLADVLGWTHDQIVRASRSGDIFYVESAEGRYLYPAGQISKENVIVPGLRRMLTLLNPDVIDRYSLAAWFNVEREELNGMSVWDVLGGAGTVPEKVWEMVSSLRQSAAH
jgi:hypothetical protein